MGWVGRDPKCHRIMEWIGKDSEDHRTMEYWVGRNLKANPVGSKRRKSTWAKTQLSFPPFSNKVTLRMFKQRQTQSEQIPVGYQHLSEVCKPYRVGEKYLEFIQALQKKDIPMEHFEFEPLSSGGQR